MNGRAPHYPRCAHRAYHITCQQHEVLLARSGGCCEICGKPMRRSGVGLFLDHDHALGWLAVRGLLCPRCNTIVHKVEDGLALQADSRVAAYLARPWHAEVGITDFSCPSSCRSAAHARDTRWTRRTPLASRTDDANPCAPLPRSTE